MAKPEWGQKRVCATCGAHFYDLRRAPIVCPKCKAEFDPEATLKARRSRSAPAKAPPPPPPAKLREEAELPAAGEAEIEEVPEDEEEAAVIEDTADLGEDEDQVATVVEPDEDQRE